MSNDNTPIFDQIRREWAATGKLYETMVRSRLSPTPAFKWEGTRPAGQVVDEVQELTLFNRSVSTNIHDDGATPFRAPRWARDDFPKVGEPIVVKTLSDSTLYHVASVSAEQALEGVKGITRLLTLEKPTETVLYTEKVNATDFLLMVEPLYGADNKDIHEYLNELAERVLRENPDHEITTVKCDEELGSYKITILGTPQTSIGEDESEGLYMKTPNFWGNDEE